MSVPVREPTEQRIQRTLTIIAGVFAVVWLVFLVLALILYPLNPFLTYVTGIKTKLIMLITVGVVAAAAAWVSVLPQLPQQRTADSVENWGTGEELPVVELIPVRNRALATSSALIGAAASLLGVILTTAATAKLGPFYERIVLLSYFGAVFIAIIGVVLVSSVASDKWRWIYMLLATFGRLPWALAICGNDPEGVRHSMAMGVISMGFAIAEIHYLRTVASNGDRVLREATSSVIDTAARASATNEAARIDGLVHDHILAALLLASRADDPEDAPFIRRSAAGALAALSEISAPESAEVAGGMITVQAFATRLIHEVRAETPDASTSARGSRTNPIPAHAATTLHAAAMEAVRNSLRHADGGTGRAVRRSVTIQAQDARVRVVVADDGVGFDQATAAKGRYGVAGSILGRLESLEGGEAEINSAPGEGTEVVLTWTDPAATRNDTGGHADEEGDRAADKSLTTTENAELKCFAELADTPTEEIALAPTIRSVLVLAAGFLYLIISTLDYFSPAWVSPAAGVVFIIGFVLTVLPWLDDPLEDVGKTTVAWMVVSGPVVLAATLLAWDSAEPIEPHLWTLMVMYVVSVMLAFANYKRAAMTLGVASAAVLVAWSLITSGGENLPYEVAVMFIVFPLAANRMQHKAFQSLSESTMLAAKHRGEADALARDLSAIQARRRRGKRVDTLARPLLERLAAGERTIAPVRVEAAQLEAHLRDDLRARCFRDTDVTRAANDARRAGVRVDLMDDGGLDDAPTALREQVIDAAIQALDNAHEGSVIVRVAPPGREVVATILTETGSGAETMVRRLEIHALPTDVYVGVP